MRGRLTHTAVQAAVDDLKNRTLTKISYAFGRLIYLASTRDYNTGQYYHDGLAFQFSEEVARKALAETHREVFFELALSPLRDLTREIQLYFQSTDAEPRDIIRSWRKIEPYRVVVPMDVDSLIGGLFLSNIKLVLPIVECRLDSSQ